MKNPDTKTVSNLQDLPNIGKAIAKDLQTIGIEHPQQLIGKNPFNLHETLCKTTGKNHDPCVLDVFMSAVDFMKAVNPNFGGSLPKKRKKLSPE